MGGTTEKQPISEPAHATAFSVSWGELGSNIF